MIQRLLVMAVLLSWPAFGAPGGEPFTFVQLCDPQLGAGGMDHDVDTLRKAVAQINKLKPDFVIICGDFTEDCRDEAAVRSFKEIVAGFEAPCHLVPGNHDVGPGSGRTAIGRYMRRYGRDHFSFDHKGYRFVVVNTELWVQDVPMATLRHDQWFEETLTEGKEQGLKLVVAGHVPPYAFTTDEATAYQNLPREKRRWLLERFDRYGVRLMLAGHLHANIQHKHGETLIAVTATTSINRDNQVMGFRLWTAHPEGNLDQQYIPVEGADVPPGQAEYARSTLLKVLERLKR